MQSERELRTKLRRREYGEAVVDAVIENLRRQGYVDDEKFALDRAAQQARVKKVGRQRAIQELCKAGVARPTAERAAARVYEDIDPRAAAVEVAQKRAASLRRLDDLTARRRLIGYLQRRGFDYETIAHAVRHALGDSADTADRRS
jgi:regulatory protein